MRNCCGLSRRGLLFFLCFSGLQQCELETPSRKKWTGVVTIEVGRTIHDAIGRPNEHKIGALIVTREGEKIIGIIPVIEQTAGPNAYIAGMDC